MFATPFQSPVITKEVPVFNSIYIKVDFLKEGIVWEQLEKRRQILQENFSPCLQHPFIVHSSQRRSMSTTTFIQKFEFLKEGVVWEQNTEKKKKNLVAHLWFGTHCENCVLVGGPHTNKQDIYLKQEILG